MKPDLDTVKVAICYKNFAAKKGISHIGLGVSAINTAKTLRHHHIWADVWPVTSAKDIDQQLTEEQNRAKNNGQAPISHLIISAPWIPTEELIQLITAHKDVHFAVISHSNVGFLMADTRGIQLLREAADLQAGHYNIRVGGNSLKFVQWARHAWNQHIAYLPNLYYIYDMRPAHPHRAWEHGTLRIGCFGATRPFKNALTAAAAAIHMAITLRADVEFHVSTGRDEGGQGMIKAIEQLLIGIPNIKLIYSGWQPWPEFRRTVRHMHLLMQPSFTESFNVVTADGIAEGVASVVSSAIDWVPEDWSANSDDATEIAKKGIYLLNNAYAATDGQEAIRKYVHDGYEHWKKYLLHSDICMDN